MNHPEGSTYPVQAWQSIWHAAAEAIEEAADDDANEDWMIAMAGYIHEESGPARDLDLSITIHFQDEEESDVARHHVRRAVDERDCNG